MDFITAVACLLTLSCHQPAPTTVPYVKAPPVYGSAAQPVPLATQIPRPDPSIDNALWWDVVPRDQVIRDCVHVAFPQCHGGN